MRLPGGLRVRIRMRAAALALVASAITPAAADGRPSAAPTRSPSAIAAAGLYWVPYVTCHDCEVPKAIVGYIVPTAAQAKKLATVLDGTLALGFPYLVHTDQLGIAPRGIAVVTGTYTTVDGAQAAVARTPKVSGRAPKALSLEADEWGAPVNQPDEPRHVTVVDRGVPVRAWSKASLDRAKDDLYNSDEPRPDTEAGQKQWLRERLAREKPACTVRPGDAFVVEQRELDWYAYAPVRCNGKLAYIEWTQSLLGHAVIKREGSGYVLRQIVGAMCDAPIVDEWRYDRDGRHPIDEGTGLVAMRGC